MKYYVLFLTSVAWAQSTSTTLTTGLNGNIVSDGSVITQDGVTTRTTKSINDGQVPQEQTIVRVLSKSAAGQVTEKIVRKFDQTGALVSTERIVTDEQKQPSGTLVKSTTYRSDINGNMSEAERKTVETTTQGAVTNTSTTVAQSTLNGFATVEKRAAVTETSGDTTHSDETVYRLNDNGAYYPAFRTVSDTTQSGGKTIEKTVQYQPILEPNKMELVKQIVTTTTTQPDGTTVEQSDYYRPNAPGIATGSNAAPRLYEQDTVERKPGPNHSVTETTTARRGSIDHPAQLGPPIKVSETVCTGNCQPSKTN